MMEVTAARNIVIAKGLSANGHRPYIWAELPPHFIDGKFRVQAQAHVLRLQRWGHLVGSHEFLPISTPFSFCLFLIYHILCILADARIAEKSVSVVSIIRDTPYTKRKG